MQLESGALWRRGAMVGFVLLAHALILWLLLQVRAPLSRPTGLERLTIVYLPPPERPETEDASIRPAPSLSHRPLSHRPAEVPGPSMPAAPGAAPAGQPPAIDWAAEQKQAAESQGREIWKRLSQRCRDAQALHVFPPECHRYVAPEPWEPEEKRFGMEGALPYVRLGRCVVGLGFWGCAVGKPPPPNGHVFDRMRDPDRPGALSDNGNYQTPPEPRERLH